ncbi:hypothetical protein BTA51_27765 [Hahella sp. CCB-MM4]|nr:hypothetical protein BTA51_27765 [Hahella sp. CCB-MM4]
MSLEHQINRISTLSVAIHTNMLDSDMFNLNMNLSTTRGRHATSDHLLFTSEQNTPLKILRTLIKLVDFFFNQQGFRQIQLSAKGKYPFDTILGFYQCRIVDIMVVIGPDLR